MKYLKNRDIYLKEINTGIQKYKETGDISAINEVLQNDIAWGDSLLGRLINSIIRKVKIGINLVKIQSVIKTLYSEFDKMVAGSVVNELSPEMKIYFIKMVIFELIKEVELSAADPNDFIINDKSVKADKPESLDEIKKSIDAAIELAEGEIGKVIQGSKGVVGEKEIADFEADRNSLIKALKLYRESLDKIDSKSETSDEKTDVKPNTIDSVYPKMIENFTSVYNIMLFYSKLKAEAAKNADKKNIEKPVEKEEDKLQQTKKTNVVNKKQEVIKDSFVINENQSPELLKAIKPLYDYSKQFLAFPEDENRRKDEFNNLVGNEQNKGPIVKIYSLIRKKSGVNENLTQMLTKPEAMADKIYVLYQVTKTKEAGDFMGAESIKGEIAKFNSTMKEILSFKSVDNKEKVQDNNDTKEPISDKKESMIFKYVDFINEADEISSVENVSDGWYERAKEFWKEVFLGNFKNIEKYHLSDENINSLMAEVDKVAKGGKFVKIESKDPVMEITRLFNRAYRLHTTKKIPSGRKDGKVSNKTELEYDEMGPNSFRNIAVFSKWQDAVYDVLGNPKYKSIFNEGSTIQIGDGDPVRNFGKLLARFMNDMLDKNKMYNDGEQQRLIADYFKIKDIKHEELNASGFASDSENNSQISSGIKDISVDFVETDKVNPLKKGQMIKIETINRDGKTVNYFAYVYSTKDGNYMKIGNNVQYIKKYLPTNVSFKTNQGDKNNDIHLIRLDKGLIQKDQPFEKSGLNISDYLRNGGKTTKFDTIKFKVKKLSILKDEESKDYIVEEPKMFLDKKDGKKDWKDIYNRNKPKK